MKATNKLKLSLLLVISLGLYQCINNIELQAQQEKREVSGFDRIGYSISGEMEIIQGNSESLVIEGDKNDLEKIVTEVRNGKLEIYSKPHFSNIGKIKVTVTVINLEGISISGSCTVKAKSTINSGKMRIAISGSGNVSIPNLSANQAIIKISGSGGAILGGEVKDTIEVHISGSGGVKASELVADKAEVHISGSGSVQVHATSQLTTRISGSGGVYYKGNPMVDTKSSGSGRTKPL